MGFESVVKEAIKVDPQMGLLLNTFALEAGRGRGEKEMSMITDRLYNSGLVKGKFTAIAASVVPSTLRGFRQIALEDAEAAKVLPGFMKQIIG
jgi:hypothetical protein